MILDENNQKLCYIYLSRRINGFDTQQKKIFFYQKLKHAAYHPTNLNNIFWTKSISSSLQCRYSLIMFLYDFIPISIDDPCCFSISKIWKYNLYVMRNLTSFFLVSFSDFSFLFFEILVILLLLQHFIVTVIAVRCFLITAPNIFDFVSTFFDFCKSIQCWRV